MQLHGWLTLGILAATALSFWRKWLPLEVTALAIPVALFALRILPDPADALMGFGHSAVMTLGAVFVLAAALQESGLTSITAGAVSRLGGRSEALLVATVMAAAAALSSLMNTSAVVILLLPAIMTVARRTSISPSRLLIPLAFGAMLGCNVLQISSLPNLIVARHAHETGAATLGMFSFARVGLPVIIACTLVMALVGRHLLPKRTEADDTRASLAPDALAREHRLHSRLFRLRLVAASRVASRSVKDLAFRSTYHLDIVAVERDAPLGRQVLDVTPDFVLAQGDDLYVEGTDEAAMRFCEDESVQFGLADEATVERLLGRGLSVAEATLAPRSAHAGKSLRELRFRERHGLTVLAVLRGATTLREGLADVRLAAGDALLLTGRRERVRALSKDPDLVLLTDVRRTEDIARAPLALLALLVAVVPPMLGWAPTEFCALVAALLAIATGCLSIRAATEAIDWRTLFMTIGLLPLGLAMERQGLSAIAGTFLKDHVATMGSAAVVLALIVLGAAVASLTTNSAAAAVLQPVAVSLARSGALPGGDALLAVAIGSNTVFLLPHQAANLQVMGPGGYRSSDFVKTGLLMTLVVLAVAVPLLSRQ